MKKVLIVVEGQTEETFVNRVLNEHLLSHRIIIEPKLITTNQAAYGIQYHGGHIKYNKVKKDIQKILRGKNISIVTTMFDYYGLPHDFPGRSNQSGNACDRVAAIENAFNSDINNRRFFSFIVLHEFEGLLFSSPKEIAQVMNAPEKELVLKRIRQSFRTPEDINDSPQNAPSKRIYREFPHYKKVVQGSIIAGRIGLETIRRECPHFNEWLNRIENIT